MERHEEGSGSPMNVAHRADLSSRPVRRGDRSPVPCVIRLSIAGILAATALFGARIEIWTAIQAGTLVPEFQSEHLSPLRLGWPPPSPPTSIPPRTSPP